MATPLVDGVFKGTSQLAIAERTVFSAAIGGTAPELGGGKFANGAVTAAFLRLYNDENIAEQMKQEYEGERARGRT